MLWSFTSQKSSKSLEKMIKAGSGHKVASTGTSLMDLKWMTTVLWQYGEPPLLQSIPIYIESVLFSKDLGWIIQIFTEITIQRWPHADSSCALYISIFPQKQARCRYSTNAKWLHTLVEWPFPVGHPSSLQHRWQMGLWHLLPRHPLTDI